MKTNELIKLLRRAVNESDEMPLSPAELRLNTALHEAIDDYEEEMRTGHAPSERRCLICKQPLKYCCC